MTPYALFAAAAASLRRLLTLTIIASAGALASSGSPRFAVVNESRIDSIIAAATLGEKIGMLQRNSMFSSAGIERLGIPELKSADGPFGVREELERNSWTPLRLTTDSATFIPTGSALAATWSGEMAHTFRVGLGQETWTRGKHVILGPAINITRTPLNGRTFEYMSEDPLLNAVLAVGYIRGVQSTGIASCVKHFAVNNQEWNRGTVDVKLSERALREIYLPAFKAAVQEAGVMSVMSAYNKVRGQFCGENAYLLNTVLKNEWGFKGPVMSDWGGTHSTVEAALNGLDIEMGTDAYFSGALLEAVKDGRVPVSVIDEKVRRILRVILHAQQTAPAPAGLVVATPGRAKMAYDIASQSIVLLKNKGKLLPLSMATVKTIAVIGDNATHKHSFGGFGAGVKARHEVTPLEGLKRKAGPAIKLTVAQGYESKFIKKGKTRLPDNAPNARLVREAVEAAKAADVAIVFAGTNHEIETEGTDRTTLALPFGQDALIKAVTAANPKTIVVVVAGAPVDMKTTHRSAPAVLYSWFNGSEGGTALADVLFGDVNPSGRLPFTFPASLDDSPAHALKSYPGDSAASYAEGILVGYRWFDAKKIAPTYSFGYGLSYTDFWYSALATDKHRYGVDDTIRISLKVKNTGLRAGDEVVQLYCGDMDPKVPKAPRELKAFRKVRIAAGAEEDVTMDIRASDLAYFDEERMTWIVSPGSYCIQAGSSSRDMLCTTIVEIR